MSKREEEKIKKKERESRKSKRERIVIFKDFIINTMTFFAHFYTTTAKNTVRESAYVEQAQSRLWLLARKYGVH